MYKILPAALVVLCMFSSNLFAQRYQFELALEGGPGFSFIHGPGAKQMQKQNPLLSFSAGIGLRFNAPKVVGVYTGIYVERKGFDWPIPGSNMDGTAKTLHYFAHYHYVTVPVMLNATVGRKVQFFVNAGGFVSGMFRIHTFQKEMKIDNVNPGGYQYVDAGFCGGLGLRVPILKRLIVSLEARNTTGFLKVVKNTEAKDGFHNTSTTFMIGIAYSFRPWKEKKKAKPQGPIRSYFNTITYPYSK